MAFVSTFVDRPGGLGRGAVGSSNLATGAVYRQKVAPSAVGTTAQGTLTATKVVGTLSTIDIGSALLSYGSAGSFVGGLGRFRYGSVYGTFRGENVRGRVGSFTRFGGSLNAAKIVHGSLGVGRISPIGSLRGTIRIDLRTSGTLPIDTRASGTVINQRLPVDITAKGTVQSRYGSAGTATWQLLRGRYGSYSGTLRANLIRGDRLSGFGSISARVGSFGTATGRMARFQLGSFKSFKGSQGSFAHFGGSLPASKITHGTLAVARHQLIDDLRGTLQTRHYARDQTIGTWRGAFGSFGTATGRQARFQLGSYRTFKGTYGSFAHFGGSLPASKITHGTLAVARHQLVDNLRGTLQTRHYARSQTIGTWIGAQGSFGTLSGRLIRTQFGSFAGTIRGRTGSLVGTSVAPFYRGRLGSLTGSIVAPLHRGRLGSYSGSITTNFTRSQRGSFARVQSNVGSFGSLHLGIIGTATTTYTIGSPLPPPPRPRIVVFTVRLPAAPVNSVDVILTQARFSQNGPIVGTISRANQSNLGNQIDRPLPGVILPSLGSYRLRNIGGGTPAQFLARAEWTL